MAGDQETVIAAAAVTGGDLVPGAGAQRPGPAAVTAELLACMRAELPVLAGLGEREELLAAAWLASLRPSRTRRACAGDVLGWLAGRGVKVLGAGRVHVDMWVVGQQDQGAQSSKVRRQMSALSSFSRHCAAHDLVDRIPTAGWRGRWRTRITPPPWAWPATRPATRRAPWSRWPTRTRDRRRCGRRQ